MLAIDDFGRPRRRAISLGPAASPSLSARTSRIVAARVTAGASESASAGGEALSSALASTDRGATAATRVPLSPLSLAMCKPLVSTAAVLDCGQYGGCRTAY